MPYWIADDDSAIDFEPSGSGWTKVSRAEYEAARKRRATRQLLELLKPKADVYPVLMRASASGMSRRYRVFIPQMLDDGKLIIRDMTRTIADACGFAVRDYQIVIGGCGFSGSFQIVYDLGCALWPDGTPEPHGRRNGKPDSAGGYALSEGRL